MTRLMTLSRNDFTALVIVISACAASARAVPGAAEATVALIRGVAENKVLFVCLGIALWHLLREDSPPLSAGHLLAAVPALFLSASAAGVWPWIGLTSTLVLLTAVTPSWGTARSGVLIALVAALHNIVVDVLGNLGGDAVLGLEAKFAGWLLSWILPDVEVEGTALQLPGAHMVILVWGCSSLSNLGDILLLFWALVSVRLSGGSPLLVRDRVVGLAILLGAITIALNTLRLTLIASDPEVYAHLHGGGGSAWFRFAALGLTAFMSTMAVSR
jgi:hypothetical protein